MTFIILVADHGDEQRALRPAALDQHAALEQHVILAIALARRVGPNLDLAVEIEVGHRTDRLIDVAIHPLELIALLRGELHAVGVLARRAALGLMLPAEGYVADRRQ